LECLSTKHTADVEATTRCFLELVRLGQYTTQELLQESDFLERFRDTNANGIPSFGIEHVNLKAESDKLREKSKGSKPAEPVQSFSEDIADAPFAHLHVHSQYSILQSTVEIQKLVDKAVELDMPAVALTDTGNMMAAFHFEKAVSGYNKKLKEKRKEAEEKGESFDKKDLIPIIGCEFNVCQNLKDKTQKDNGYQVVLLAKNKNGYQNLIKLASIAYTEGMYYVPRIDREVIQQYKEDIIVLSGNMYGEISSLILNVGETQAEQALLWWKSIFDADFYLEIMRHDIDVENRVNETLVEFSAKHKMRILTMFYCV